MFPEEIVVESEIDPEDWDVFTLRELAKDDWYKAFLKAVDMEEFSFE